MIQIENQHKRIQFMDGYDLYPNQYVLLGDTEEYENQSGTKSGLVLAVGESTDRDTLWDLYEKYLLAQMHEGLYLFYFGDIHASGVYV